MSSDEAGSSIRGTGFLRLSALRLLLSGHKALRLQIYPSCSRA